jgi:hypothetical protein
VVLLFLLVGGLTQVSRQSHSYDVSVNRSLATQGAVVVDESNATAAELRSLMTDMQTQARSALQADLDGLVHQADNEAAQASRATGSVARGGVGVDFSMVLRDRAQAVDQVRFAVDGLLGMHPLPVAGAAASSAAVTSTPTLLSSTEATDRLAAAGALLSRSDQLYRTLRQSLGEATGRARLPASTWVTDPQLWEAGSVATQVDEVASSSTLAVTHDLVLRTVRLTPPALPTVNSSPSGPSILTPTTSLGVSVVLSNLGSVDEPHASVQFTLALQPTGATMNQTRTAAIATAGSVTLGSVFFRVKPGTTYLLTVSVVLPPAQPSSAGSPRQKIIEVAPGT